MYLKKQGKSTKYRKILDSFLIFPKYREYRKYRMCGSPDQVRLVFLCCALLVHWRLYTEAKIIIDHNKSNFLAETSK